jgi:hypothetical protein
MKKHSAIGANTLATVLKQHPGNRFLTMGVTVVRSRHEKWDGSGYPDNLKGDNISLAARIVALADYYDAPATTRPRPQSCWASGERPCSKKCEGKDGALVRCVALEKLAVGLVLDAFGPHG